MKECVIEETYVPAVLKIISNNITQWGNPLGMADNDCTGWAKGLNIPNSGSTIFYSGCEYQMASRMQSLVKVLKKVKSQDNLLSIFDNFQSKVGEKGINLMGLYARFSSGEKNDYERLLRMMAMALQKLEVNFAYMDGELYSGALLYEYGLLEEFYEHAKRVMTQLKERRVRKIIALTPHSAEIFKLIYPKFIGDFDFEISPYISTVAQALKTSGMELSLSKPITVTLHDACHLARSLKVTEEPREVIRFIKNLNLREVTSNKQATACCGAPCEILYPELSELIAARRVEELSATGAEAAVTMCPFCYLNLNKGAKLADKQLEIIEFGEILYRALGGENDCE